MSKYSPVRVANPLIENHLVYVHPTQKIQLLVAEYMQIQDVDVASDFLVKSDEWQNNNGTCIHEFEQTADFTEWCDMGDTFLGEILLIGNNSCSSLCVILSSQKKTHGLTVINPSYCEVKAHPHQTLEIILFEKAKFKVYPASGLQYRLTGEEILRVAPHSFTSNILKQVKNSCVVRPRRIKGVEREYHYWFELGVNSLANVMSWKKGTYSGGKIMFSKDGKGPYPHVVSMHLNVRRKTYHLKQKRRTLSQTQTTHVRSRGKVFVSTTYRTDPEVREVVLEPMAAGKLDEGCKTLEFTDTGPGTLILPSDVRADLPKRQQILLGCDIIRETDD